MNIEGIRNWGRNSAERARSLIVQAPTYVQKLHRGILEHYGSVRGRLVEVAPFLPPAILLLGLLINNEAVVFGGLVITFAELGGFALTCQKAFLDKPRL